MADIIVPDEKRRLDDPKEISAFLARSAPITNAGPWRSRQSLCRGGGNFGRLRPGDRPSQGRGRLRHGRRNQRLAGDAWLGRHAGRFRSEHTHSEDEVRSILKGRGLFHIHPDTAPSSPSRSRPAILSTCRWERSTGSICVPTARFGPFVSFRTRPVGRPLTSTAGAYPLHAGLLESRLRRRRDEAVRGADMISVRHSGRPARH